jgi:A/G-specific adenine glycosylase
MDRDPYRIWVSEIMLQQTQVKTVIPYYEAFMERFPDVASLASATVEDVLSRWSGLGYYRRARQLHGAALAIVELGRFPTTARDLEQLPGIGPYTAAAVASMAFGEAVPVLDGNVERLLCRRCALAEDPKRAPVRRQLLEHAAQLLDDQRPGDSNQAMMELGALVCRPQQPACGECPLRRGCKGRTAGPESFPPPRRRRSVERSSLAVVVAERQGKVLLFKRSSKQVLMPGLWELPSVPASGDPRKVEQLLSTAYGGTWKIRSLGREVRHSITHRSLRLKVYRGTFSAGDSVAEGPEAAWVDAAARRDYALSSMVEKVLASYTEAMDAGAGVEEEAADVDR